MRTNPFVKTKKHPVIAISSNPAIPIEMASIITNYELKHNSEFRINQTLPLVLHPNCTLHIAHC